MKPRIYQSVKRIRIGDTFTVQTPKRTITFRVMGIASEAWVKGEVNTYHVERVIN